jgi:hypothetical protein
MDLGSAKRPCAIQFCMFFTNLTCCQPAAIMNGPSLPNPGTSTPPTGTPSVLASVFNDAVSMVTNCATWFPHGHSYITGGQTSIPPTLWWRAQTLAWAVTAYWKATARAKCHAAVFSSDIRVSTYDLSSGLRPRLRGPSRTFSCPVQFRTSNT